MRAVDFNDIHCFTAAVEAGGFAAAARRLNLSRSAVGRAVSRLEQRLGARLVQRTTRQFALTSDGGAFLQRCRRALEELQAGRAALDQTRRAVEGRLRVAVPVLFGRVCAGPVLARLAARHPGLELQIEFSDRVTDLVAEGFDLAVRNGPLGDAAGLVRRKLTEERTVVCGAPGYLERCGVPDGLAGLSGHHAITYGRRGRAEAWLFPQAGGPATEVRPPSRLCLDDLGAIADAAAAGLGLAWLPSWLVADRLRDGALVAVLPEAAPLMREIHAVWPRSPALPPRVRVAIDALAERLRSFEGHVPRDQAPEER